MAREHLYTIHTDVDFFSRACYSPSINHPYGWLVEVEMITLTITKQRFSLSYGAGESQEERTGWKKGEDTSACLHRPGCALSIQTNLDTDASQGGSA